MLRCNCTTKELSKKNYFRLRLCLASLKATKNRRNFHCLNIFDIDGAKRNSLKLPNADNFEILSMAQVARDFRFFLFLSKHFLSSFSIKIMTNDLLEHECTHNFLQRPSNLKSLGVGKCQHDSLSLTVHVITTICYEKTFNSRQN